MESPEVTDIRTPEQDEKFGEAFKGFLRKYLNMSHEERRAVGMGQDFELDLSDPRRVDMLAILGDGDFDVRNIVSSPRSTDDTNSRNYSFYAGVVGDPKTEIHISKGAADVLRQRLQAPPTEPQQS